MLPRLTPNQNSKWQCERTKGRLRFVVVRGVCQFGGIGLSLWVLSMWLTSSPEYFARTFLAQPLQVLLGVIVFGTVWGLVIWEITEFRYRRSLSSGEDGPA